MEYQHYLSKQLSLFHYHLLFDYGALIKAATCIAFGAVCGWIMSLITFVVYKTAVGLGVKPRACDNDDKYDDLDLDVHTEYGYGCDRMLSQCQELSDWLVRTQ
ncbi:uncharacterized protein LOC122620815 [Drosophila teissieri]|uniref:uncharacterized protein LOC122619181 n=1 Tax=Drosophila teissieri TaxID=7243 RepID=UPI001CBA1958|nr:uncharacterized protein LOC122619181 [Drosophila teissieri]XP_043654387.1 uncharacterized protein LOC122620815 [Drosophila teissieri]